MLLVQIRVCVTLTYSELEKPEAWFQGNRWALRTFVATRRIGLSENRDQDRSIRLSNPLRGRSTLAQLEKANETLRQQKAEAEGAFTRRNHELSHENRQLRLRLQQCGLEARPTAAVWEDPMRRQHC